MTFTRVVISCLVGTSVLWVGLITSPLAQEVGLGPKQSGEVVTLKIEGWTCASCEKDIRRALRAVSGVKEVDVSYARGGAVVAIDPTHVSQDQLVEAVASAGTILSAYQATVVPNGTLTAEVREQNKGGSWFKKLFK